MRMMRILTLLPALAWGLALLPVTHAETEAPVTDGATVLMEYTITVPEAKIIIPKNVSQFVPGHHDLLPNLEKALTGMKKGEQRRVDLSADEAFGPYDEAKKTVMPVDHLPSDVKPGMVLTTKEGVPFVVMNVTGGEAQVDFNHPLAGKHVIIDVKILEVQPPGSAAS
jgi:FKBP-type peptidyl-prolyl cis-trans isomerase 2